MGLVLDWQKKLGYRTDPFVDEPFYKQQVVGLDALRKRVNLFLIKSEQLGMIRGAQGMGKSTLLKWLEHELRKMKYNTILFNAHDFSSREKLFVYLFKTLLTFVEKRVHKVDQKSSHEEKEQMVLDRFTQGRYLLLIDDAGSLVPAQCTYIDELLSKTKVKILLADELDKLKKLPLKTTPTLRESIRKYPDAMLEQMLQLRISSVGGVKLFPFDQKALRKVHEGVKTPRDFLKAARECAIELSLKVEGPPPKEKPKKEPREKPEGGFAISLFGKKFVIPSVGEKSSEKGKQPAPKTATKKTARPSAKNKQHKVAKKKWGFLTIEYDEKEHEDAEFVQFDERGGESSETTARRPTPPLINGGDPVPKTQGERLSKEARHDAELLAEIIDEAEVEVHIEEEKHDQKHNTHKGKPSSVKATEEIIKQIASEVEKKTHRRK